MAGAAHDNYNLIQFRLRPTLLARVDEQVAAEAAVTNTVSRNTFCKRVLEDALEKLLGLTSGVSGASASATQADPSPVPAE